MVKPTFICQRHSCIDCPDPKCDPSLFGVPDVYSNPVDFICASWKVGDDEVQNTDQLEVYEAACKAHGVEVHTHGILAGKGSRGSSIDALRAYCEADVALERKLYTMGHSHDPRPPLPAWKRAINFLLHHTYFGRWFPIFGRAPYFKDSITVRGTVRDISEFDYETPHRWPEGTGKTWDPNPWAQRAIAVPKQTRIVRRCRWMPEKYKGQKLYFAIVDWGDSFHNYAHLFETKQECDFMGARPKAPSHNRIVCKGSVIFK